MRAATLLILVAALPLLRSASAPAQDIEPQPEGPSRAERQLLELADRLIPTVAELRGLDWRESVPRGVRSRFQMRAIIDAQRRRAGGRSWIDSRVLAGMGVVPEGHDALAAEGNWYADGMVGYFDTRQKELWLVLDTDRPDQDEVVAGMMMQHYMGVQPQEVIIAHELTHALDDQHFGLLSLLDPGIAGNDRWLARNAVVEGSAVSVQKDLVYRRRGVPSCDVRKAINEIENVPAPGGDSELPLMLLRRLMWPYTVGNRLVFEARRREGGGWERVNRMFEDLPVSTEQVLHPEKYLDEPRDYPVLVILPGGATLAAMLGDGWEPVGQGTLGEFMIWSWLEQLLAGAQPAADPRQAAEEAAAGWDGDTWIAASHPEHGTAVVWSTAWDTPTEAAGFYITACEAIRRRYGIPASADGADPGAPLRVVIDGRAVSVERRDRDVVVLLGVPAERAVALSAMALNAERRAWQHGAPAAQQSVESGPSGEFDGREWTSDEAGFRVRLPRPGFERVADTDGSLRATADGCEIVVRRIAAPGNRLGPMVVLGQRMRLANPGSAHFAVLLDEQGERNGTPVWRYITTDRADDGAPATVTATGVIECGHQVIGVTVRGPAEHQDALRTDLEAVLGGLEPRESAGDD